ncbi:MAG: hypothetical protein IBX45_07050 [Campylobacterales bacterium]|nr:hypothetical protein [Campylobacterales bacterium]
MFQKMLCRGFYNYSKGGNDIDYANLQREVLLVELAYINDSLKENQKLHFNLKIWHYGVFYVAIGYFIVSFWNTAIGFSDDNIKNILHAAQYAISMCLAALIGLYFIVFTIGKTLNFDKNNFLIEKKKLIAALSADETAKH